MDFCPPLHHFVFAGTACAMFLFYSPEVSGVFIELITCLPALLRRSFAKAQQVGLFRSAIKRIQKDRPIVYQQNASMLPLLQQEWDYNSETSR